jgi:hypothetical protein
MWCLHFMMVMKLDRRWYHAWPRVLVSSQRTFRVVYQNVERADFAIDKEPVSGLPTGPLHIMAIYEVREGLIRSLLFIRWGE